MGFSKSSLQIFTPFFNFKNKNIKILHSFDIKNLMYQNQTRKLSIMRERGLIIFINLFNNNSINNVIKCVILFPGFQFHKWVLFFLIGVVPVPPTIEWSQTLVLNKYSFNQHFGNTTNTTTFLSPAPQIYRLGMII